MMDYLRGKIKSGSPCLLNDDITGSSADSWRTRSALRRRDDIFSSAYSSPRLGRSSRSSALVSRFRSPSSSYQIKTSDTYKKYSESPLDSPSLANSRKTSIVDSYLNRERKEEQTSEDTHHNHEVIDYKELYEKEKKEKEECEAKMKELEKHLQTGLQRFLDLKKVLDSFHEEIEYTDDSINGFIQSIIPDFHSWAISGAEPAEEKQENKLNNQNKHDSSPSKDLVEDTKDDINQNLVLPMVNYEWIDVAPSKPPLYVKHLKRFTNSFSSRTEKLKLNIHFAGDSRNLPTKIHIEIRDCKGRVVFR